jgi:hypothetical protein
MRQPIESGPGRHRVVVRRTRTGERVRIMRDVVRAKMQPTTKQAWSAARDLLKKWKDTAPSSGGGGGGRMPVREPPLRRIVSAVTGATRVVVKAVASPVLGRRVAVVDVQSAGKPGEYWVTIRRGNSYPLVKVNNAKSYRDAARIARKQGIRNTYRPGSQSHGVSMGDSRATATRATAQRATATRAT